MKKQPLITVSGILGLIFLLSACVKEQEFSPTPKINAVYLSTDTLSNGDYFDLIFDFEDGGNDLGAVDDANLGEKDISIIDSRDSVVILNNLPKIDNKGSDGFTGTVSVKMSDCCKNVISGIPCSPTSNFTAPFDTLSYIVQIKDRSQHWSNTLRTPVLYIACKQ
ncbi:MAG: hypothetical protein IPL35_15845 [Sphingobacteriales bacterium]|nr:hypothetical protein [Sphingobacteriales bacterium]